MDGLGRAGRRRCARSRVSPAGADLADRGSRRGRHESRVELEDPIAEFVGVRRLSRYRLSQVGDRASPNCGGTTRSDRRRVGLIEPFLQVTAAGPTPGNVRSSYNGVL
jgi:hypothetical protein